jgi:hypothetical protein
MGLPPVTSAVFLIANYFGKTWVSRRNIWDTSATPSGIKGEWYVYVCYYACTSKGLVWWTRQKYSKNLSISSMDVEKATTLDMDCDGTKIGLPPAVSAVFLIAK